MGVGRTYVQEGKGWKTFVRNEDIQKRKDSAKKNQKERWEKFFLIVIGQLKMKNTGREPGNK